MYSRYTITSRGSHKAREKQTKVSHLHVYYETTATRSYYTCFLYLYVLYVRTYAVCTRVPVALLSIRKESSYSYSKWLSTRPAVGCSTAYVPQYTRMRFWIFSKIKLVGGLPCLMQPAQVGSDQLNCCCCC